MALSILGLLVDPTNEYKNKLHKGFSQCLVWLITLVVGNVVTIAFILPFILLFSSIFSLFNLSPPLLFFLIIWSLLEIIFYFYCYSLRGKLETKMNFPTLSPSEKEAYLDKILKECRDPIQSLRGWFYRESHDNVGVECMASWLSWAFFSKDTQDLNKAEKYELDRLVEKIIERSPELKNGKISSARPLNFMRLHFDEVVIQHKPLVAYVVISAMQACGSLYLKHLGFVHKELPKNSSLSYWYYEKPFSPKTEKTSQDPIFIVYGIGIGVAMYFKMVKSIISAHGDRNIVILELPHISLKIVEKVPSYEETLDAIDTIYKRHDLKKCSWLAHSYGTIVSTWVINSRPHFVSKVTFVDPVCFTLWEPHLIYNFLYKEAKSPITRLCQFFVAQDLLVSSTLFRNFSWIQNLLFPQDLSCPATIFISSHDFVIDPKGVVNYLENVIKEKERSQIDGHDLKVFKMNGLSHGSILASDKHITHVLEFL